MKRSRFPTQFKLASVNEQVVIFAGLSSEWETEGYDREHMNLPPYSDELISRVLEANPNAAAVIQSGTPFTMPWVDEANVFRHSTAATKVVTAFPISSTVT